MKIIKLLLFMAIIFMSVSCTSKNDFRKGKKQLEAMGYTDVKRTGYKVFCCSKDDDFSTGFKAKDKYGNEVEGCFCSSLFKGVTIRFR